MNKKISLFKTVLTIISTILIFILYQLSRYSIMELFNFFNLQILGIILSSSISIVICYGLSALWVKKVLKLSLADFRLGKGKLKPLYIIISFAMPLFMLCLFLLFTNGSWTINDMDTYTKLISLTSAVFVSALWAGICEEILFRSMLLSVIEARWNRALAIIITSFGFGAIHIINGNMGFVSFLQLFFSVGLIGILFAVCCIKEGNIWNNVLIHALWNFLSSNIFTVVPVETEISLNNANLQQVFFRYDYICNNTFISGGEYGYECSVFSIVTFIVTLACMLFVTYHSKKKTTKI